MIEGDDFDIEDEEQLINEGNAEEETVSPFSSLNKRPVKIN